MHRQQGVVIIVCLFVLLAVMSLGIFGMRNVTLSERAAGNTLEKQRSFQAAESGLRYGEWWLSLNNHGEYINCSDTVDGNTISLMRVCTNALANPADSSWTGYTTYTPENMTISNGGGLASNGDINYLAQPKLYISYLGKNRRGDFFQLSATGYGGQESTASVLQSTFTFSLSSIDLGDL
ncbi:PilX N-terminal domain-containing pilus assembly protein [Comamonas aquatilis]|uniref:pilus assembly PilX family protein n=1 Tax=Comamonas aquatilis TaxID=1778406 RepID=UPI0039F034AB